MKLPLIDTKSKKLGEQSLPEQFNEAYRPDLIQRAVQALQSSARQSYGNHPEAGKRSSSKTSKRRRKYRGTYGFGISRVRRKILSRRGTRFNWVGAFSAQAVGGKRAHPPKGNRIWERKINKKELCLLFPNCDINLKSITLAPPLTRALAPISTILCQLLEKIPLLCTHYIGTIQKR